MNRWSLIIAAAMLAGLPMSLPAQDSIDAVLKAEEERIEAIARATRSAVAVFARGGRGGGSGVVITPDGYALTNFHVVKPAGSFMKCSMSDGRLYDAVIVGIDPVGDVALIKLLGRSDFPAAVLADSDQVRVGDWCFAIGNPFLLATDFQPTVTYGIVSGTHRYQYPAGTLLEYADCIQTDASINPGNSGGPLFNAQGELIGINGRGSFEKRGRVNVGVGYAISINQIKHFMGYLHSGRIVDHATLGASVVTDEDGRVVVSNILESCDAYRRGLRYGDEVLAFGGRPITTVNGFKNVLGIYPRGWRVPLSFRRDGKRHDIFVRLAGVHSPDELIKKVQGTPRPAPAKPGDEKKGDEKKGDTKKAKKQSPEKKKADQKKAEKKKADQTKKKRPVRPAGPSRPAAKPVPPEIAKLIVARRGYANYYFNLLNRDRVWKSLEQNGSLLNRVGTWTLHGEINNQGKVEIELGDEEIRGQFPVATFRVDLKNDLDTQLAPRGSGGLLVALHLWQRMLTVGPQKYGDVYYLGTGPVAGHDAACDVLVATYGVTECRFYFDPASGHLISMEMFPEKDSDPCELFFDNYQKTDGRSFPGQIRAVFGDTEYGVIEIKKVDLPAAGQP